MTHNFFWGAIVFSILGMETESFAQVEPCLWGEVLKEDLSVSVTHFTEGERAQKLEAGENKAEEKLGDYKACK